MKKNTYKVFGSGPGKLKNLFNFISFLFTTPGIALVKRTISKTIFKEKPVDYNARVKSKMDTREKEYTPTSLKTSPTFSIILLAEGNGTSVKSILAQIYPHWELLLVDNGSGTSSITVTEKCRIIPAGANDSSTTRYNAALQAASGDFILFLRDNTLLSPDCLFEFAKHIDTYPADRVIYTDEDIINNKGEYSNPYFKPDWSPDSFLSRNYIGDAFIINTQTALALQIHQKAGGDEFYDLLLRAAENTNRIGHIPHALFHFREFAKHHAASENTVADALIRCNTPATIDSIAGLPHVYRIKYAVSKFDKVSIIIPTKDQTTLLRTALDSIFNKTTYPDYEVVILNNNSTTPDFFDLVNEYSNKYPCKFRSLNAYFPFNFAKLINMGVAESKGEYILMLNNDIEVIDGDWVTKMVGHAQHRHTGAVGVKLLYPDDTIQHAGIILGINDDAGHAFINMPGNTHGYFNSIASATNYSAVTAACLMCRRELYNKAGGMNEDLAVEYNDLDLCLRFSELGHYNVYIPAEMYHHESATRGHPFRSKAAWLQHEKDFAIFKSKWGATINNDPFYNQNLSRTFTDFRLK